jgi:hypothetical protein
MHSFISSFRDRRIAAFLLAGGLAMATELVCTFVLPNPAWAATQTFRRSLIETKAMVQIAGDSAVLSAIDPRQLAGDLGLPEGATALLHWEGTGPVFAYYGFRLMEAKGSLPDAIVYMPSPHTFGSSRIALFAGLFASSDELVGLAVHTRQLSGITYGLLCRGLYCLRYRDELRELLSHGDRSALHRLEHETVTQAYLEEGKAAGAAPPKPGKKRFPLDKLSPSLLAPTFTCQPYNDWALRALLVWASDRRIPVLWGIPPVPEALAEHRRATGYSAEYAAYVQKRAMEFNNVTVLAKQTPLSLPDSCFFDSLHLNVYGRRRFTAEIAPVIRASLARAGVLADAGSAP